MLHVRQLWRALHAVPQLLLVQPEQLSYDVVYALALVPPMATGIFFFRRSAALLIALCFLTGIVCLLALQLARLTINLPAWVGFRANHPLISGLIVACFLSPQTPAWLGVSLVLLLVVLDHVVWPQLGRTMVHPALVVFGILFVVQKQLPVGFVNPFDGRRLDDPLSLWHRLGLPIDPVKLYVGNVPGPIAATSAAAVLLGIAYLWYGRKISAAVLGGFVAWFLGLALIPALVGWLLAGPVALGLLARFVWRDTVRRARPTRIDYGWTTPAYYSCLLLAIAATALAAYEIAVWFGRSGGALL